MKKILLTTTLSVSFMMGASNPSYTYSYELTPFTAGILTDSKSGLKDDTFYRNYYNAGISLGKNLKDSFLDQIELGFVRSESIRYENSDKTTNINRTYLNIVKKLGLTEKLAAYGIVGAGYQDVTGETEKHEDSLFLNYGIGLRYDIPYYGMAFKTDVRHLFATKHSQNSIMYTLGLAMPLGKQNYKEIATTVPNVEEPKIEEPKKIVKIDNDFDKDGVINKLDKCPDTSPNVKVNKDGCVATVNLKINFEYNSASIKDEYNDDLQKFAQMLKDDKSLTAVIEAHTDSIGSNKYNQSLSEKRAFSTLNKLKTFNIDTSRLKAIGYGETQPIASNETEEGRAQNRRVTSYINK